MITVDIHVLLEAIENATEQNLVELFGDIEQGSWAYVGQDIKVILKAHIDAVEDETKDEMSHEENVEDGHESAVEASRTL